jgi:hypothetical protein
MAGGGIEHSGPVWREKAALIFIVLREVRTLRSEIMGAAFSVLRERGQGSHRHRGLRLPLVVVNKLL